MKRESGFTLVELMVVVAIIGILARVAVANFQKFQARTRQSEAKIALASLYAAEVTYFSENSTFTACLLNTGFAIRDNSGNKLKSFYTIGFSKIEYTGTSCGPNGNDTCVGYTWSRTGAAIDLCGGNDGDAYYEATAKVNSSAALPVENDLRGFLNLNQSNFTAGAVGSISSQSAAFDVWTINSNKFLTNTTSTL